jgi:hypothetical protein
MPTIAFIDRKRYGVRRTIDWGKMYGEFHYLYWKLRNFPGAAFRIHVTTHSTFQWFLSHLLSCLALREHIHVMLEPNG